MLIYRYPDRGMPSAAETRSGGPGRVPLCVFRAFPSCASYRHAAAEVFPVVSVSPQFAANFRLNPIQYEYEFEYEYEYNPIALS